MTDIEIMFDGLFISLPDGRVAAGRVDAEAFLTEVKKMEANLRDAENANYQYNIWASEDAATMEGLQEALAVYRKYIDLDVSHISQKAQAALDAIKESK